MIGSAFKLNEESLPVVLYCRTTVPYSISLSDRDIDRSVSALSPAGLGIRYGSIMWRKLGLEMLSRGVFGTVIGKSSLLEYDCVCSIGFFGSILFSAFCIIRLNGYGRTEPDVMGGWKVRVLSLIVVFPGLLFPIPCSVNLRHPDSKQMFF